MESFDEQMSFVPTSYSILLRKICLQNIPLLVQYKDNNRKFVTYKK